MDIDEILAIVQAFFAAIIKIFNAFKGEEEADEGTAEGGNASENTKA